MTKQDKKFEQGIYENGEVKVIVTEEGCIFCFVPKSAIGILCEFPYAGIQCESCPLMK